MKSPNVHASGCDGWTGDIASAGGSSFDYECRRYKFAWTVKDRGVVVLYRGPPLVDNGLVLFARR